MPRSDGAECGAARRVAGAPADRRHRPESAPSRGRGRPVGAISPTDARRDSGGVVSRKKQRRTPRAAPPVARGECAERRCTDGSRRVPQPGGHACAPTRSSGGAIRRLAGRDRAIARRGRRRAARTPSWRSSNASIAPTRSRPTAEARGGSGVTRGLLLDSGPFFRPAGVHR